MTETQPQAAAEAPAPMSLKNGVLITALLIVAVGAWIYLGGTYLAIKSAFATFLLLWYWANVEGAAFSRMPASVIGALTGVGLALLLRYLPAINPQYGLAIACGIVVVAVFVQIMNWAPIALNASAMLFVTVMTAPGLLMQIDMVEMAKAIVIGAVFFMGVVKVAHVYSALEKRLGHS